MQPQYLVCSIQYWRKDGCNEQFNPGSLLHLPSYIMCTAATATETHQKKFLAKIPFCCLLSEFCQVYSHHKFCKRQIHKKRRLQIGSASNTSLSCHPSKFTNTFIQQAPCTAAGFVTTLDSLSAKALVQGCTGFRCELVICAVIFTKVDISTNTQHLYWVEPI